MSNKKRQAFLDLDCADEILSEIKNMIDSDKYNTESSYIADAEKYPNHEISFYDKHVDYLISHPNVNPNYYLANLKLISRIR